MTAQLLLPGKGSTRKGRWHGQARETLVTGKTDLGAASCTASIRPLCDQISKGATNAQCTSTTTLHGASVPCCGLPLIRLTECPFNFPRRVGCCRPPIGSVGRRQRAKHFNIQQRSAFSPLSPDPENAIGGR